MDVMSAISFKFYGYYSLMDHVLTLFSNLNTIDRSVFFRGAPSDAEEKIEYLIAQGLLKESPTSLSITFAGRLYQENGGFRKDLFRKFKMYLIAVVGTLCGIISLILQLVL